MIRLNRRVKIKTGEILTPYLIDDDIVSCFDRKGNTLYKELKDFSSSTSIKKKKSNVVIVSGYSPEIEDETLFETNVSGGLGGAYEERKQSVKIVPKKTTPEEPKKIVEVEVESSTMDEIPIEPSSGIKQVPIPEINIENKTKTSGNGDSTFEIKKNDEDLYDDLYGDF